MTSPRVRSARRMCAENGRESALEIARVLHAMSSLNICSARDDSWERFRKRPDLYIWQKAKARGVRGKGTRGGNFGVMK